eukprot:513738-Prorocentrum_minimum.AAC.1
MEDVKGALSALPGVAEACVEEAAGGGEDHPGEAEMQLEAKRARLAYLQQQDELIQVGLHAA